MKADTEITESRRVALCEWLTANGINPNRVPMDADLTVTGRLDGARFIQVEVFDLDATGHKQVDERGTHVATKTISVPLVIEPPEWWKPYVKPTRDELLATVARVRALPHQPEAMDPSNPHHEDYLIGYRNAMNRVQRTLDNPRAAAPDRR